MLTNSGVQCYAYSSVGAFAAVWVRYGRSLLPLNVPARTAPGSELQCALPLGYQQHPSSVIDIETLFAVRVLTISAFAQTHHLPDHSYGGPAGPQKICR